MRYLFFVLFDDRDVSSIQSCVFMLSFIGISTGLVTDSVCGYSSGCIRPLG